MLADLLLLLTTACFCACAYFLLRSSLERKRLLSEAKSMRRAARLFLLGTIWHDGRLGNDGKALISGMLFLGCAALTVWAAW